jgi:hypothetical protein
MTFTRQAQHMTRRELATTIESGQLKESRTVLATMFHTDLCALRGTVPGFTFKVRRQATFNGLRIDIHAKHGRKVVLWIIGRTVAVAALDLTSGIERIDETTKLTGSVPGDCTLAGPEFVALNVIEHIRALTTEAPKPPVAQAIGAGKSGAEVALVPGRAI